MHARPLTFLQTGFRPFFLGAMLYSVVAMTLWTAQLMQLTRLDLDTLAPALWHGREMVFGYAMAVISGFLLTAVQNWTGGKTAQGNMLLALFTFWLLSRLIALYPSAAGVPAMLVSSVLFYLLLLWVLVKPLIQASNHAQWGIIGKLCLFLGLDTFFLASAIGWVSPSYARPSLLIAMYTVIGLILMMAQRVVPSFTRNAIAEKTQVQDYRYVPSVSLVGLMTFAAADVLSWQPLLLTSGLVLFIANALRLYGWYTSEIFRRPLVWVLHLAVAFISIGFVLRGAAEILHIPPALGLHAMAYGGIGLITIGMMARVSLGHTGRNVFEPPKGLALIFMTLAAGAILRVLLPILAPEYYFLLIQLSQFLWISAFIGMLAIFARPLLSARVDGRYG
ncbi:MAG: NnrS family protein [Gammaproteobacteria bacterium]|jgi:uncharacterized protein involved in response to NO|nr:NnrS family protein [Gammaproteobacteria bacterium]